jgi:3-dehydroquinate dehydratase-2
LKKVIIINGPNLNLIGEREKEIYGNDTFEGRLKDLRAEFSDMEIDYFQSNIEGEIIDSIQKAGFSYDGIILNAGGYTHTSVAIGDAVKAVPAPLVEVHISNIYSREEYRHKSFISPSAKGCIIGFGLESYRLALISFRR